MKGTAYSYLDGRYDKEKDILFVGFLYNGNKTKVYGIKLFLDKEHSIESIRREMDNTYQLSILRQI
jgi:hypothetical protein